MYLVNENMTYLCPCRSFVVNVSQQMDGYYILDIFFNKMNLISHYLLSQRCIFIRQRCMHVYTLQWLYRYCIRIYFMRCFRNITHKVDLCVYLFLSLSLKTLPFTYVFWMPLYLTIVFFVYSFIYVLKVGDWRPFGANVITFTMYRLWIKCSYSPYSYSSKVIPTEW